MDPMHVHLWLCRVRLNWSWCANLLTHTHFKISCCLFHLVLLAGNSIWLALDFPFLFIALHTLFSVKLPLFGFKKEYISLTTLKCNSSQQNPLDWFLMSSKFHKTITSKEISANWHENSHLVLISLTKFNPRQGFYVNTLVLQREQKWKKELSTCCY